MKAINKFTLIIASLFCIALAANSSNLLKIQKYDLVQGDVNSNNQIIVYSSLGCALCHSYAKSIYPSIKAAFIDTKKVAYAERFISTGLSRTPDATKLLFCSKDGTLKEETAPDDFYRSVEVLMATSNVWSKGNFAIPGALLGIDKYNLCLLDNKITKKVNDVIANAEKIGITGTPLIVINGKKYFISEIKFEGVKPHSEQVVRFIESKLK